MTVVWHIALLFVQYRKIVWSVASCQPFTSKRVVLHLREFVQSHPGPDKNLYKWHKMLTLEYLCYLLSIIPPFFCLKPLMWRSSGICRHRGRQSDALATKKTTFRNKKNTPRDCVEFRNSPAMHVLDCWRKLERTQADTWTRTNFQLCGGDTNYCIADLVLNLLNVLSSNYLMLPRHNSNQVTLLSVRLRWMRSFFPPHAAPLPV